MDRVLLISSVLSALAVIQSFGLLYVGKTVLGLDQPHLQTMMFLQLVVGGHLMLFLTRSSGACWHPPFPNARLFWAIVVTQVFAALMAAGGWLVPALPWSLVGLVWAYNLAWMIVEDIAKLALYRTLNARRTGTTLLETRMGAALQDFGDLLRPRRGRASGLEGL
jgi:H+-transporting ATPase